MNKIKVAQCAAVAALFGICAAASGAEPPPKNNHRAVPHDYGPEAARQSLKNFTVANGVQITLFASEPMLRNPTDMDIDERGRVWIAEGVNYRSSFQPWGILQSAGDRIIILEDTNGDGFADKETVFYQGPEINAALGICVLGNRVIVSCSPNIYLFTDTNGDGQADKKEILFSGISGVDHDHGVHAVTFGPDGKLYFNFGNEGKQLKDKNGQPVFDPDGHEINNHGRPYRQGMAFRCNPDGSEVEVLAHNFRNPYELAVDSFGTLWQSDNDDDGNRSVRVNYVMEHGNFGYADEMTGAGWQEPRSHLENEIPNRHWHQNDPGVVPNLLITGAGAPTGILVYEGKLLPEIFRGQMILADAGTRTVRGYPVQPDGAGYKTAGVDLLFSSDSWFRPSDVCAAPDGSVYVCDWNDAGVGGHNMADRDPDTMTGRVFRLAPPGSKPTVPKLDLQSAAGCVDALQSPNLSTRYLAWTALKAMGHSADRPLLNLWQTGPDPRMSARALYVLAQEKDRTDKYVEMAFASANPDLRITGLRIAREAKLNLIPYLQTLVDDPSPRVRRECAIALRHNSSPEAPKLWTILATKYDGRDRWYLEALGIGADGQDDQFFATWLAIVGDHWDTAAGRDIIWRSRAAAAAGYLARIITDEKTSNDQRPRFFRAFDFIPEGAAKEEALAGLLQSDLRGSAAADHEAIEYEALARLKGLDLQTHPVVKAALLKVLASTRGTANFVRLVQEFHLAGHDPELLRMAVQNPGDESAVAALQMILANRDFAAIQEALADTNTAARLIEALGNTRDREIVPLLLPLVTNTQRELPARREAVRSLSRVQDGAGRLIQLAQDGALPNDLKLTAATELNRVRWPELKSKAAALLPLPQGRNGQALPPIADLLKRTGEPARGAQVFTRADVNCIGCHRVNNKGVDLGPALSEIGAKLGKDALYEAILDPSAGIEFGYEAWLIRLKSGDEAYGIITSETADELIVKDAKAVPLRVRKSDIVSRQKSRVSLMPAGLQQAMTTQDLADLVEYLSSLKKAAN
jgi:putative membrane-bound dehydrogenase-like protein